MRKLEQVIEVYGVWITNFSDRHPIAAKVHVYRSYFHIEIASKTIYRVA